MWRGGSSVAYEDMCKFRLRPPAGAALVYILPHENGAGVVVLSKSDKYKPEDRVKIPVNDPHHIEIAGKKYHIITELDAMEVLEK